MDRNTATKIAAAIVQAAQTVANSSLKKIWLYGSVASCGSGNDLDLILEVDHAAFSEYAGQCTVVLDGVRPVSDDLLFGFYGAYWEYHSPKAERSMVAISTVGIAVEQLNLRISEEILDIICLPEGWDDKTTTVYGELQQALARSRDPNFLRHAAASKKQLFPVVSTEEVEMKEDVARQIFIAARHGSYDDETLNLDDFGKKQMELLAAAVQEAINGSDLKISLLCSTAPRAEQGGKILIEILGIPQDRAIFHECFWDDSYHRGNAKVAQVFIEEHLQDGTLVLALSHLDMVPQIAYFVRKKFGTKGNIDEVQYGQALMVTPEGVSIIPKR